MRALIVAMTIGTAALGSGAAMAQTITTTPDVLSPTVVAPNEILSPSEQEALGLEDSLLQNALTLQQENQSAFEAGQAGFAANPTLSPITGLGGNSITGVGGQ